MPYQIGTEGWAEGEAKIENSRKATEYLRSGTVRGAVRDVRRGGSLEGSPSTAKTFDDRRDDQELVTVCCKDAVRRGHEDEDKVSA